MDTNTLIVAVCAALAPTIAILVTYVLSRRDAASAAEHVAEKVDAVATTAAETSTNTEHKLEEIHVLVNSRLTEALNRIDQLEKSLGIPPDSPVPKPRKGT
jgi:hypothetical protein